MDITSLFIEALSSAGIPPADAIIGDGKLRRYTVVGDSKRANGWYRLTIDGDLAWGVFGSWKHSVNEKWFNKERREYSPIDLQKIKDRQAAIKAEEEAAQAAAAVKAAALWKRAQPLTAHPYVARKGIKPLGARLLWGKIVVPAYNEGAVVGLQFISDDGNKIFMKASRQQGSYASIANKGDSRDTLLLCEGWSTGCSLYEATGWPVICCFNAANLVPVAQSIRQKYPDAKIYVVADNDSHITENRKFNVGLHYGAKAAEAIKAQLVYPIFADNEGFPSDANDLHSRAGLQAVKDMFKIFPVANHEIADAAYVLPPADDKPIYAGSLVAPYNPPASTQESAPEKEDPEKWKHYLQPGKVVTETEYFPFPYDGKSDYNVQIFLKHHPRWKNLFIFNEFSGDIVMTRHEKWLPGNGKDFKPRFMEGHDITGVKNNFEQHGFKTSQGAVLNNLELVAQNRTICPPRTYFEGLKWDGQSRLDTWLSYYMGADEQPLEYLALVGAKWLIGAVSRIYQPGCKFDTMLILEGKQGIGKSTALKILAGEDWFLDSLNDIHNKDTLMGTRGKLIVEIPELASFKKSENEAMKAFVSRQSDVYRKPYGAKTGTFPRYFVLAATTNELDEGYLKDETGNRRYWPVKCGTIDNEALARDREMMWAEAVVRYKAGERVYLTVEETKFAFEEQAKRMNKEPWIELIGNIIRGEASVTLESLMKSMDLKPKEYNDYARHRIKKSLRALEWHEESPGYWKPLHALHIVKPDKVETLF